MTHPDNVAEGETPNMWTTNNTSAAPLTKEKLLNAIEKVREMSLKPSCSHHIFHPNCMTKDGWYRCGNCFVMYHIVGGEYKYD